MGFQPPMAGRVGGKHYLLDADESSRCKHCQAAQNSRGRNRCCAAAVTAGATATSTQVVLLRSDHDYIYIIIDK